MISEYSVSRPAKVASVIIGTLMTGFMWRCRGETGFGSSWGMYCIGLVLCLIIWTFYGKRKGMKTELIGFGALLAGVGVTGYGTVIEQMSGMLWSDIPYNGEVYFRINETSGLIIILIMAFTFIPLFSFFTCSLFSGKEYKLKNYLLTIVIFFGVSYVCKATIANPILKAINPEQVDYAAKGLVQAGYDYSSPFAAYMAHFGNRSWTEDISFFENYYMSVEHISDAFGILAIAIYALTVMKDKVTFAGTLIINAFVSVVSGFSSSMISVAFHTGYFENMEHLPGVLRYFEDWGMWEYTTGAAVGFIIMLFIALLPNRYTKQSADDTQSFIKNDIASFVFNAAIAVFISGVTPARAFGLRIGKLLENEGIIEDKEPLSTILLIAAAVVLSVILLLVVKKTVLDQRIGLYAVTPTKYTNITLPVFSSFCCILYFFANHAGAIHFPYSRLAEPGGVISVLRDHEAFEVVVMFFSFAVSALIYVAYRKLAVKKHK